MSTTSARHWRRAPPPRGLQAAGLVPGRAGCDGRGQGGRACDVTECRACPTMRMRMPLRPHGSPLGPFLGQPKLDMQKTRSASNVGSLGMSVGLGRSARHPRKSVDQSDRHNPPVVSGQEPQTRSWNTSPPPDLVSTLECRRPTPMHPRQAQKHRLARRDHMLTARCQEAFVVC
jgi:hypothetical protein